MATVTVRYEIGTSKIGSECSGDIEFDRDEWEAMSDSEKEAEMREAAFNEIDWHYAEVENDD